MIDAMPPELNEPCCPDISKRVCYSCRRNIRTRIAILAHNLAVAGALGRSFALGVTLGRSFATGVAGAYSGRDQHWWPGCGRSAP